jgi:hypothetical protein
VDDAVVDDEDQRGTRELRIELQLRRLARAIGLLVEGDLEGIGRVGANLGVVVARIEPVARGGLAVVDFEEVRAPLDRGRDGDGTGGDGVDSSVPDLTRGGDAFPLPDAALAVPLVVGFDARQPPVEA